MTSAILQQNSLVWIQIPAANFRMGSTIEEVDKACSYWSSRLIHPDYVSHFRSWLMKELPCHDVFLEAFEISDTPVTNALYRQFCVETGSPFPESMVNGALCGGDDHPVWGVSITEARAFCTWYSQQFGVRVTLPSEAQWEYAARGSEGREFPWGDSFDSTRCNTVEAGKGRTTPVRQYENGRSPFGLYDMGGNVEEWVDSLYKPYKGGVWVADDLVTALGNQYYVLRGGSFACGGDLARSARRHGRFPNPIFRFTGFRLVKQPNLGGTVHA